MPATISGLRPTRSDQWPVRDLRDAPDGRVERGDQADLADAGAVGGEEERNEAPGEGVVEVVDQAGLRARAQRGLAVAGVARTRCAAWVAVSSALGVLARLLERDVGGGVAHEEHRDDKGDDGDDRAGDDEYVAGGELARPASRSAPAAIATPP